MVARMEHQLSASARKQLNRFCRQYLQVHMDLDYPDGENLRNDLFQQCLHKTVFEENVLKHKPPLRYQLRVLKELTRRIESSVQDWDEEGVSDDLMNSLSSLLVSPIPAEAVSVQQKAYITYTISELPPESSTQTESLFQEPRTITLLESRNIVAAAGTTGLRTWEATFHLSSYIISHSELVTGKNVLELGAGTGYLSILCSKYLKASHVLATDGSDDVVSSLSTNFYLNELQDSSVIESKELRWGRALLGGEHPQWEQGRRFDLVLGSDLTYDQSSIPALVGTFGDLFALYPEVKIVIAATIRNPATVEKFLEALRMRRFGAEEIRIPLLKSILQEGPFYSDRTDIMLCLITRQ